MTPEDNPLYKSLQIYSQNVGWTPEKLKKKHIDPNVKAATAVKDAADTVGNVFNGVVQVVFAPVDWLIKNWQLVVVGAVVVLVLLRR